MQLRIPFLLFLSNGVVYGFPAVTHAERDAGVLQPDAVLVVRQLPYYRTDLVGDGDPHQNFIFKQVSGTTDCTDNPSGSAAITNTQTIGWSVSVGLTADWISGGFSVEESVSTGTTNSFGCKTDDGTQTGSLCVFERIQVTAYTVESRKCYWVALSPAFCEPNAEQGVMFSPNSVQGSCYYDNFQVGLPCGVEGSEIHINNGPAGGPQFIPCNPYLP